jgi:16S rRNA (guanine966-N2)-methyltransferase
MKVISGKFKNRPLKTPKGEKTRPTASKIRESVFNILHNQIEGARFLDLFAGSGSMGIEALSHGAKSACFVEQDRLAANCIRENLAKLGIKALVLQKEAKIALKLLAKQKEQFDVIYIDPPYHLDVAPFLEKIPPLLAFDGIVILEQSKKSEIDFSFLEKMDEREFGDTTLYFLRAT